MPMGFIILIILFSISTMGWLFSIIVLPIAHKFNKLKQFDTMTCMFVFWAFIAIFNLLVQIIYRE